MNTLWNLPPASAISRWALAKKSNLLWLAGGGASVALVLISCSTTGRTLMAPPNIPGATFIGSQACAECHEDVARDFRTADHAKLKAKGNNSIDMGCESCHGPGSKHQESGGAPGTIINPDKSPDGCYQCHLDIKAQFSLPYSHQVASGKMTCSDCHDPHKGSMMKGGGTSLDGRNSTCVACHTAQRGPFVFPHDATYEGCTTCHNPHGSVNPKMLTERNSNLCQKCHNVQQLGATDQLTIGSRSHSAGFLKHGTCWTTGCHEGVHGSNVSHHLRN